MLELGCFGSIQLPGVVGGFDLPDEPMKPGTVTRSKVELSPLQRGHDAANAAPRM